MCCNKLKCHLELFSSRTCTYVLPFWKKNRIWNVLSFRQVWKNIPCHNHNQESQRRNFFCKEPLKRIEAVMRNVGVFWTVCVTSILFYFQSFYHIVQMYIITWRFEKKNRTFFMKIERGITIERKIQNTFGLCYF